MKDSSSSQQTKESRKITTMTSIESMYVESQLLKLESVVYLVRVSKSPGYVNDYIFVSTLVRNLTCGSDE